MSTLRQAAQQALEALEQLDGIDTETECVTIDAGETITALRTALAQPDQEQQIETLKRCLFQMQEAAKNLVEQEKSLTPPQRTEQEPCIGKDPRCPCQDGDACHYKDCDGGTKARPVAQPEKEPVAMLFGSLPVFDTPPAAHPWVGLTDEEVKHLYPYGRSVWGKETYEAIEKALKEKNGH
jgi:hypothetical protein